jgi:hypothetical protein
MQLEHLLTAIGISISIVAGSAAIGGYLAYSKRRPPLEGVLLGLLLGPIGVLIEMRTPHIQRPMVDENAWNTFRSMMTYQQTGREFDRRSTRSE